MLPDPDNIHLVVSAAVAGAAAIGAKIAIVLALYVYAILN
jgi:hypothetical protein